MSAGSKEMTRRAAAHLTGLSFAVTYLAASMLGVDAMTALVRGSIAALAAMCVSHFLCRAVVDVVLDAAARDEVVRAAERAKEEQS